MEPSYEARYTEPGLRKHLVRFVGGSAAVTKVLGRGVTVTYISTGLVDIGWSTSDLSPGASHGIDGPAFQATTQSGVKGYSVVAGVYNTSTRKLRIAIYDASNNLVDLAALQWLTFYALFVRA